MASSLPPLGVRSPPPFTSSSLEPAQGFSFAEPSTGVSIVEPPPGFTFFAPTSSAFDSTSSASSRTRGQITTSPIPGSTSSTSTPTSHSQGPTPSAKPLKSSKLPKAKAGPIVGGALAVLAVIFAFFLWRYLVLRTRKRRQQEADAKKDTVNLGRDLESHPGRTPGALPGTKEISRSDPPAAPQTDTQTKAALRQQYLASELRAIEKQQEALRRAREQVGQERPTLATSTTPGPASNPPANNTTAVGEPTREGDLERQNEMLRQRIRELEEQQQSDWARGLSDLPPPGYSE